MAISVTDDLKTAAVNPLGSIPVGKIEVYPVSGHTAESKGLNRTIFDMYDRYADSDIPDRPSPYDELEDKVIWPLGDKVDYCPLVAFNWGDSPPLGISPEQLADNATWGMKLDGYFHLKRPEGYTGNVTYTFGYVSTGYAGIAIGRRVVDAQITGSSPHSINEQGFRISVAEDLWVPISIVYVRRNDDGTARQRKEERFVAFWKDSVDNEWRVIGADVTCPVGGRYTNIVNTPITDFYAPKRSLDRIYQLQIHESGGTYHFHWDSDTTEFVVNPGEEQDYKLHSGQETDLTITWSDSIADGDKAEIQLVRGKEVPWELPLVRNINIEHSDQSAGVLRFGVPVTVGAYDEDAVSETNAYTYDLSTDSFGVLRIGRHIRAYLGYKVSGEPEYVRRFTGIIQDVQPDHQSNDGAPSITLDVVALDSRSMAIDPPVKKIEDIPFGPLPNDLSYDMAQHFPEDLDASGPDGIRRPPAYDSWPLADIVRTVLYQNGFNSSQLWAKDDNGNFLIDDRGIKVERTTAYPFNWISPLGASNEIEERIVSTATGESFWLQKGNQWFEKPVFFYEGKDVYVEQVGATKDMPYLYPFPLDSDPWRELVSLCQGFGLDLDTNTDGDVYLRYPNNPKVYSSETDAASLSRLFTMSTAHVSDLDNAYVSPTVRGLFDSAGYTLSRLLKASILEAGKRWQVYSNNKTIIYEIRYEGAILNVYGTDPNHVEYDSHWTRTTDPSAIGGIRYQATSNGAEADISFEGVGLKIILPPTTNSTFVQCDIDGVTVDGITQLDSTTGDVGHTDWIDGLDDSNRVNISVAGQPNLERWYYSSGVYPELGKNPAIITICDNLTYGKHRCVVRYMLGGNLNLEGFAPIVISTEVAQHTFDATTNLIGISSDSSLGNMVNDIVVVGNQTGVALDYIAARSVDLGSIGVEGSSNYVGRRKSWAISDPKIINQDRADYLANHITQRYSHGVREPLLESTGLPWLEPNDPIIIRDIREGREGNDDLAVVGYYGPGDVQPDERLGRAYPRSIASVPFQRYWVTEITEEFTQNEDTSSYMCSVKGTSLSPLPAYDPVPEPDQNDFTVPITNARILIDGGHNVYNPYAADGEGRYVNIEFGLAWHASLLRVDIIAIDSSIDQGSDRDPLRVGDIINVITLREGFVPAGKYEFKWDGWVDMGDGKGYYAFDGNYGVRISTERYSTGSYYTCNLESGTPSVVSGSLEYIRILRNSALYTGSFDVEIDPAGEINDPEIIYDLETNGGLGVKIDVTLGRASQIRIPIYVRELYSVGFTPVNGSEVTDYLQKEWVFYLLGDESPVLEPGSYTFYFNPAQHLTFNGQKVGFLEAPGIDLVSSRMVLWRCWHFRFQQGIETMDKGLVVRHDVPSGADSDNLYFCWGGPRENDYSNVSITDGTYTNVYFRVKN